MKFVEVFFNPQNNQCHRECGSFFIQYENIQFISSVATKFKRRPTQTGLHRRHKFGKHGDDKYYTCQSLYFT